MKKIYVTIFLVSGSMLMFEVSLTRLFSIHLWYHFAFLVISIAMLGIGSAGTLLALYTGSTELRGKNKKSMSLSHERVSPWIYAESNIALYAALTGISISLCYIMSNYIPFDPVTFLWERKQFLFLALYCFVLSIPFFFAGIVVATAFLLYSKKSMSIYSSDLLGAGSGSLIVLVLLNIAAPEYAVVTASALCLAGSAIAGKKLTKFLALLFLVISLSIIFTSPGFIHTRMSPYKKLPFYLKYPGAEHISTYHSSYSRIDTFKSPAVRYAPGLSLKYLDPLPEQVAFSIDGENVNVITEAGEISGLTFLEFLPSSLAYEVGKNENVLIIDPKGGLQALVARYYGSRRIHKVESNPMIVNIISRDFSKFSGEIYDQDTWTGYGRNFLEDPGLKAPADVSSIGNYYDIVDISMTTASVSGIFGISEDYRYTVEAFKKYLRALNDNGILSISFYLIPPPRTEYRILATIIASLEQTGVNDTFKRVAAIRSWDSMVILVKNSPFNPVDIQQMKRFTGSNRFDLVYYPGIQKGESNRYVKMVPDEYFEGFQKIINPDTRASFIDNYLFDIKPVYDDNPFFHYYLKLNNIKPIYEKMGRKWLYFISEGYLLPMIFLIISVFSIVLILLPVVIHAWRGKRFERFRPVKQFKLTSFFYVFIYFAMLGWGFMFIEITLIQKSILALENPSYSIAVVLTAMLISSGIGSMSGSRFSVLRTPYSLLILVSFIFIYSVTYPLLISALFPFPMKARIAVLAASLMPLGFFMGIPFPMGMKLLGQKSDALIPWAWAVNACMSVLAPIVTIMLALLTGFKLILWISIVTYLTAFCAIKKLTAL